MGELGYSPTLNAPQSDGQVLPPARFDRTVSDRVSVVIYRLQAPGSRSSKRLSLAYRHLPARKCRVSKGRTQAVVLHESIGDGVTVSGRAGVFCMVGCECVCTCQVSEYLSGRCVWKQENGGRCESMKMSCARLSHSSVSFCPIFP